MQTQTSDPRVHFRIVPQQKQTWVSMDCGLCFFLPKQEPKPLAKSCWGHTLQPKLGLYPITAASAIPTLHPTAALAWALHLTHWAAQKQNQTNMSDRTNSPLIFLFQVSPSWRDKVRRRLRELNKTLFNCSECWSGFQPNTFMELVRHKWTTI